MLGAIFLSLYFTSLVSFSFVTHPVVYCILLMLSALGISGYGYFMLGFSWYLAIFCLVYVGGVYVLFIFVSVHSPNQSSIAGWSWLLFFFFELFFLCLFWNCSLLELGLWEKSQYLCSYFEGFTYCLFCLVLMMGFLYISVVVSSKDSFFR